MPQPSSFPRRYAITIAALGATIALVIAGFWAGGAALKNSLDNPAPPTATSSAPVSSPSPTSNKPRPTSEEKPVETDPYRDLKTLNSGVSPAGFGTFSMTGPAHIEAASYDSMPYELPLNPAGPQATMVRWVDGWGQSPATAEQGTTYVLGHAWGQQRLVFNPISEVVTSNVDFDRPTIVRGDDGVEVTRYHTSVLNGSVVTMTDPDGHGRAWEVTGAYLVNKYEAIDDSELVDDSIPGRIVLIACSVDGSVDLEYNVIVTGELI